jgi:hypothetical protein
MSLCSEMVGRLCPHYPLPHGARAGVTIELLDGAGPRQAASRGCARDQVIDLLVKLGSRIHQGLVLFDRHEGGWPHIGDHGPGSIFRFGDENFDGSEQACGDVVLDHGDGDEADCRESIAAPTG